MAVRGRHDRLRLHPYPRGGRFQGLGFGGQGNREAGRAGGSGRPGGGLAGGWEGLKEGGRDSVGGL